MTVGRAGPRTAGKEDGCASANSETHASARPGGWSGAPRPVSRMFGRLAAWRSQASARAQDWGAVPNLLHVLPPSRLSHETLRG